MQSPNHFGSNSPELHHCHHAEVHEHKLAEFTGTLTTGKEHFPLYSRVISNEWRFSILLKCMIIKNEKSKN